MKINFKNRKKIRLFYFKIEKIGKKTDFFFKFKKIEKIINKFRFFF